MKSSKPSPWAWVASIASLALLAIVIVLIKVPVDQIEKSVRAREIRAAVHQRLFQDARTSVHRLFEDSWGESLVRRVDTRGAILWTADPAVIPIIDVLTALDADDLTALRAGLVSPELFPAGNVPYEVRGLSDAIAELDENSRKLVEARNAARRIIPEYLAARDNLRLFLGFPPEAITPDQFEEGGDNEEEFRVYESGVLADLPKLKEIPGDYKDLPELRKALDTFGVQVKVSGPNPMQDFQLTIGDLRDKFASARAQISALKKQESEVSSRRTQIERQMDESRNSVRKAFESRLNVLLSSPSLFERINRLTIIRAD